LAGENMERKLKVFAQPSRLSETVANIALVAFFSFFIYRFAVHYIETHRLSSLLYVFVESMFVIIAFTRRKPSQISTSFSVWIIAFSGALLPLLAMPTGTRDYFMAQALQFLSVLLQGYGILSLNKSFGLVAANRGIVTGGFYRFVRHPLYFSYFIGVSGFLINHFSLYNAFLFSVFAMCQIQRIRYEEDLLRQDRAYKAYMKTTRWRLIPYIY
jgi:protein-S-isoprenylcysteine O-methyltransferase Ste14